jgi:protein dithiol oxidoreductase (disulfide-forming)
MRIFQKILGALSLATMVAAATLSTTAGAAAPADASQYRTLPTAQNTDSGKKIEVTEFFAYYCPHCHVFEPLLAAWVKQQGDRIVFKRVHVPRDENVLPQQRLFFTLEAMGLLDQYHAKVFHAMHVGHERLNRDEAVFDFIEKQGIDRKKFIDTYRSFGIDAKLRRAAAMMDAYQIDQWPMIAIDGRFLTSPSIANQGAGAPQTEAGQQQAVLQVMDYLVARAQAEKK